jgi:hypothetical protein
MGRQLFERVTTLTLAGSLPGLSPRARLVLLGMAMVAHDKGSPPDIPAATYFGRWDYLAQAWLAYPKLDSKAERAVARAIAELVEAGVVVPMGRRGGSRGPRMYRLNIWLLGND